MPKVSVSARCSYTSGIPIQSSIFAANTSYDGSDHEVVLDILRKQNYRIGRGALGILILYEQRKEEWEKDKKTLESEFDNSEDCIQKREDSKKKEEEATLLIKDTLDDLRVSGRFLELMDSPMKRRWVCMVKRGKVKEQKLDNPGRMRDAIMILINEMDGTDWDESKFSIEG